MGDGLVVRGSELVDRFAARRRWLCIASQKTLTRLNTGDRMHSWQRRLPGALCPESGAEPTMI